MFVFTEHAKNYLYNLLTKTEQRIIKLKYVANIYTYQLNVSRLRPRSHPQYLYRGFYILIPRSSRSSNQQIILFLKQLSGRVCTGGVLNLDQVIASHDAWGASAK